MTNLPDVLLLFIQLHVSAFMLTNNCYQKQNYGSLIFGKKNIFEGLTRSILFIMQSEWINYGLVVLKCVSSLLPFSRKVFQRNMSLMRSPKSVSSPQYSSAGCLLTLHHSEKPDHEEVCEFRPYTCPCPGATCKWHGSLEAVMPHLMHAHKSITTLQVSTRTFSLHHWVISCIVIVSILACLC